MENQITERDVEDFLMANEAFFKNLLAKHRKKCEYLKVIKNANYGGQNFELLVPNRDIKIVADLTQFKMTKETCTIVYEETSFDETLIADCSVSWVAFLANARPDLKEEILAEIERQKEGVGIWLKGALGEHTYAIQQYQKHASACYADLAQKRMAVLFGYDSEKEERTV